MKKKSLLGLAIMVIAIAVSTSSKTYALADAGSTISICPGSPESCTGTVEVPGIGKVTVNSTKNKGGGTVVVS